MAAPAALSGGMRWRPMAEADLPAVVALAGEIHPDHPESPAVFAERLALAPAGCFALEAAGGLAGYALSHPWTGLAPPPIDTLLGALPAAPGAWHIHDIALVPSLRGRGLGGAAAQRILAVAARMPAARPPARAPSIAPRALEPSTAPRALATLVALAGRAAIWAAQGFVDAPCADPAALASYGAGARFMARPLPPRAFAAGASAVPGPRPGR